MRKFSLVTLAVFLLVCVQTKSAINLAVTDDKKVAAEDYDDGDDAQKCQPSEADTCFTFVKENLLCHVHSTIGRKCTQKTAKDMCVSLDDALNCTSDIIDTDCSEPEGRAVFDNWLTGLRGVQARLCRQGDYSLLSDLLESNRCWNFPSFIRCVENKANLTHISDLLTTNLDQHECNLLQMIVSVCNDKAEKNRVSCRGKADAVNVAVAAFFAASPCAGAVPAICKDAKPREFKPVPQSQSHTGLAVFVTLGAVILVIVLLVFILIRKDVITVNTRFRLPSRDGDVIEEAREDYGRFL